MQYLVLLQNTIVTLEKQSPLVTELCKQLVCLFFQLSHSKSLHTELSSKPNSASISTAQPSVCGVMPVNRHPGGSTVRTLISKGGTSLALLTREMKGVFGTTKVSVPQVSALSRAHREATLIITKRITFALPTSAQALEMTFSES